MSDAETKKDELTFPLQDPITMNGVEHKTLTLKKPDGLNMVSISNAEITCTSALEVDYEVIKLLSDNKNSDLRLSARDFANLRKEMKDFLAPTYSLFLEQSQN